jgi:hypothetical protein
MSSYKDNKNNTEGLARRLVPWLEGGGVRCGWRTIFFYVGVGESFPRGRIFALKASKSGRIFEKYSTQRTTVLPANTTKKLWYLDAYMNCT